MDKVIVYIINIKVHDMDVGIFDTKQLIWSVWILEGVWYLVTALHDWSNGHQLLFQMTWRSCLWFYGIVLCLSQAIRLVLVTLHGLPMPFCCRWSIACCMHQGVYLLGCINMIILSGGCKKVVVVPWWWYPPPSTTFYYPLHLPDNQKSELLHLLIYTPFKMQTRCKRFYTFNCTLCIILQVVHPWTPKSLFAPLKVETTPFKLPLHPRLRRTFALWRYYFWTCI